MAEDNPKPGRHLKRRRADGGAPAWLIGLIIASILFGILFLLRDQLGIGDDPSFFPSFAVVTSGIHRKQVT